MPSGVSFPFDRDPACTAATALFFSSPPFYPSLPPRFDGPVN